MNEEQVNVIVEFWKQRTGRAAPKRVSFEMLNGGTCGFFFDGAITLHPIWADDETVFHELAHLEQWQDGRLWYNAQPIVSDHPREVLQDAYHCYFRAVESVFEGEVIQTRPYRERPVEIEARRIAKENLESFRLTNPWPVVA